MSQFDATDRERLYGVAGRAAGEAALLHGRDGGRLRPATDAFVLSRIARAIVDAIYDDLMSRGQSETVTPANHQALTSVCRSVHSPAAMSNRRP